MAEEKKSFKYLGYTTAIISIVSSIYGIGYWYRGVQDSLEINNLKTQLEECKKKSNCIDEIRLCDQDCDKKIKVAKIKSSIDFLASSVNEKTEDLNVLKTQCERCESTPTCIQTDSCVNARILEREIAEIQHRIESQKKEL